MASSLSITEEPPPAEAVVWGPQGRSQLAFLACPLFEVLYEGERGGGKTDALLMDFGQYVGRGFGAEWRGILFRQTYPQLQDVIAKTQKWFPQIWPRARYNGAEHYWAWPAGEQLFLRHFSREPDYWNYHGHAYPWIGWEELCNWANLGGYKRMMSCCRSTHKEVPRRLRATTNPYGPGHNVVKHRFRLPGWRGRVIMDSRDEKGVLEPPRIAVHAPLDENYALMEGDPDYRQRISAAARNPAERAAWLEGSWDIVAGGMFDDCWDAKVHQVRPFEIPASWRIDRSFDWGSSRPFSVGWWAESDGTDVVLPNGVRRSTVRGDLFRIHEWYGWNGEPNEGLRMLAVDVAKGTIERELRWGLYGRVRSGPADTSIFDAENGVCIATDMAERITLADGRTVPGVQWDRADKSAGSRRAGWEKIRELLTHAAPEPGRPREKPGLFVFDRCDQFLRTVPVLPRSERDPDDVDTNAEDHIGDETRYRVRMMRRKVRQGQVLGGY